VFLDYHGQQIFIIHPEREFREKLVHDLRENEFETFGIPEADLAGLSNRREAVLFLHVSDENSSDWRNIGEQLHREHPGQIVVALGTAEKPAGFDDSIEYPGKGLPEIITGYLDSLGARGHRHYIRFGSQNASIATFEFHQDEMRYAGIIHDISAAGASCTFRPEPEHLGHVNVDALTMNLPGHPVTLGGRFAAGRVVSGQIIHVFNFSEDISNEARDSIHDFIYSSLETKLSLH
jgi:hypothetical protein